MASVHCISLTTSVSFYFNLSSVSLASLSAPLCNSIRLIFPLSLSPLFLSFSYFLSLSTSLPLLSLSLPFSISFPHYIPPSPLYLSHPITISISSLCRATLPILPSIILFLTNDFRLVPQTYVSFFVSSLFLTEHPRLPQHVHVSYTPPLLSSKSLEIHVVIIHPHVIFLRHLVNLSHSITCSSCLPWTI